MKLNHIVFINIVLFLSLILLSACGSDHDHGPTPVGLVLTANGADIAMQEETTVTYVEGNSIEVPENTQLEVQVHFISEDGNRYFPDENDGFFLEANSGNNQILNISHPVNNHEWTLTLIGLSEGSTTISFELWHVDHSDFESRPFQVTVTENLPE